ncbi:hypothetical protein Y032_0081g1482 [Ancylostoma ceylanicum]|uniref:Uncharacterized protein n=1 Tax=Ancylostoma ceylanicum TaxID=53326 RepID=A0A016TTC1_9BILA|nr:hypothetical protein Y032_0081g1482 [Ancylostoma ceylanicum]
MLAFGIHHPSAEPRRASYALSYVLRLDSVDAQCNGRQVFFGTTIIRHCSDDSIVSVLFEAVAESSPSTPTTLRVYGVKIWPHVCNTVKLKRGPTQRRELYRKCTGLVLKRDPNVFDRSLSRLLAKRYSQHGLWAGTLTRFALVIRNKLRPNNNSRTIPLTVIDDDDEKEGTSQSWPEIDIGGVFPHGKVAAILLEEYSTLLNLSRKRTDFDRLFNRFMKQTHQAYLISKPTLKSNVLRGMVLEAFKGKETIRSITKGRIEVVRLWKICNAMASLFHAYNNQVSNRLRCWSSTFASLNTSLLISRAASPTRCDRPAGCCG